MTFTGSMTAMVTPFRNGALDEKALRDFIDWQIDSGTDGLIPSGTTGEAATLTLTEKEKLFRITVEQAKGRVPVIAGTGSNSTAHALELAKLAKACKVDAHLSVTPYYNKPTQEGLFQHYKIIAETVDLPLILYNVPGRTAVNMTAETQLRLAELRNVVGTKEASGNLEQIKEIANKKPKHFVILSGEDAQNVEIYALGGLGHISVTGNVAPEKLAQIWDVFAAGNLDEARRLQTELQGLHKVMFIESNPQPAKTALAWTRGLAEEFRLPLIPMSANAKQELKTVLKQFGILKESACCK